MDPHINPDSGNWDDNYYARTHGGGSSTGGSGPSFDPAAYDNLIKGLPSSVDFAKTLNTGENDVFGAYAKKALNQPKPLELYGKLEESAGIPKMKMAQSTLQGQVYDLEDTIRRVEPDIAARSRNSIVTEAQRRGMSTAAKEPLIENLGWLGQSLGRVSSAISNEKADISNKVGMAMEGFRMELEPYKEKLSLTVDQNSRMMSGFTADKQSNLDVLLAKIQRQEQVSDMEWQQAQDLAKEERVYEQNKTTMMEQFNQPDNKIVEANGRQMLINMKTGEKIADLGSSKTASGGTSLFGGVTLPTSSKPTAKPTQSTSPPRQSAPIGTMSGNWYSIGNSWIPMIP